MKKFLYAPMVLSFVFSAGNSLAENVYMKEDIVPCYNTFMCTVNGDPITGVVKDYYMNGVLKDEGNYEDGLLNGFAKTYYENGNLKSEEIYKNGIKCCLSKTYYENGNLEVEGTIKNGKIDGIVKGY